ncbi:unnamed protein product [Ectocarpus sp. 6 AP-2014]
MFVSCMRSASHQTPEKKANGCVGRIHSSSRHGHVTAPISMTHWLHHVIPDHQDTGVEGISLAILSLGCRRDKMRELWSELSVAQICSTSHHTSHTHTRIMQVSIQLTKQD